MALNEVESEPETIENSKINDTNNDDIKDDTGMNTNEDSRKKSVNISKINEKLQEKLSKFSGLDCGGYVVFLVVFTIMAIAGRTVGSYNYIITEQTRNLLSKNSFRPSQPMGLTVGEKTLESIDQISEIYDYIELIAIPLILNEKDASNNDINTNDDKYFVAGQNKLLGGIRLRQLKVNEVECEEINSNWKCYPEYNKKYENKSYNSRLNMKWFSGVELNEDKLWWGIRSDYWGGGYKIDFNMNKTDALIRLDMLKRNQFFDESTRLIVLDFNTYNPSLNLHCLNRIGFETAGAGGVLSKIESKAWNLFKYKGNRGWILFLSQIIFGVFVIILILDELRSFLEKGFKGYITNKWHVIDVINLILCISSLFLGFYQHKFLSNTDILNFNEYKSFRNIKTVMEYESNTLMINGAIIYFKMFEYLTFSERVRFLFKMLDRSSNDLLIFCIVLFVLFLSFGIFGYVAFNSDVSDFRSFTLAVHNLVRYVVSEPPYNELNDSNRILGSVYFVTWGIIMLLILSNVFIAILSDAYSEVIADIKKRDQIKIKDMLRKSVKKSIFNRFKKKNRNTNDNDISKQNKKILDNNKKNNDIINMYNDDDSNDDSNDDWNDVMPNENMDDMDIYDDEAQKTGDKLSQETKEYLKEIDELLKVCLNKKDV